MKFLLENLRIILVSTLPKLKIRVQPCAVQVQWLDGTFSTD